MIEGMIEMVTNAETLRKIQVELGLTGSFKDRPIAEWLAKHNPSALEYERAVANFTGKSFIILIKIILFLILK
jgi:phosphatidylinositol-4-phosphate 3-kinase